MPATRASYSAFSRGAHWVTLVLLIGLFALAWLIDDLPLDLRNHAAQLHVLMGYIVIGLTILRIAWRLAVGAPKLPGEFPAWQRLAVRGNEIALYLLLLAQPLVGWLWLNVAAPAVNSFFLLLQPWLIGPEESLSLI